MKLYSIKVVDIHFRAIAKNKKQALESFKAQIIGASNIGVYMSPDWAKLSDIKVCGRIL